MKFLHTMMACAAMVSAASTADAATVNFSSFESTNTNQLNPVVSISDDVSGEFLFTVALTSPEYGDLVSVYFDIDPSPTNSQLGSLTASSVDPVVAVSGDFTYQFLNNIDAETDDFCENNILSGGLSLPAFEGSVCYRQKGDNQPDTSSPAIFKIVDTEGVLSLEDFASLGIRYRSSSNIAPDQDPGDASDKLYGLVNMAAVPLPASGLLLLSVLGAGAFVGRRKKAA